MRNFPMRQEVKMLDIIAAIYGTAYCAAQIGLLIGLSPVRGATKLTAFAAAAAWLAIAVALLLLATMALGFELRSLWLKVWNAFGALDLLTALTLAVLSAPGTPFRVFVEGPGTQVMATLPWVLVPAILVPIDLLVHFAIAAKLKSVPRATRVLATAN